MISPYAYTEAHPMMFTHFVVEMEDGPMLFARHLKSDLVYVKVCDKWIQCDEKSADVLRDLEGEARQRRTHASHGLMTTLRRLFSARDQKIWASLPS